MKLRWRKAGNERRSRPSPGSATAASVDMSSGACSAGMVRARIHENLPSPACGRPVGGGCRAPSVGRVTTPSFQGDAIRGGELVHLPRTAAGGGRPPLDELRPGDVDEWGRSEHARELARRLYDPIYRKWF